MKKKSEKSNYSHLQSICSSLPTSATIWGVYSAIFFQVIQLFLWCKVAAFFVQPFAARVFSRQECKLHDPSSTVLLFSGRKMFSVQNKHDFSCWTNAGHEASVRRQEGDYCFSLLKGGNWWNRPPPHGWGGIIAQVVDRYAQASEQTIDSFCLHVFQPKYKWGASCHAQYRQSGSGSG